MKNLITILFLVMLYPAFGQGYRLIKTQEYENLIKTTGSETEKQNIESVIAEFTASPGFKDIIIPVIFHVLYDGNNSYPEKDQIINQLEALNKHFRNVKYSPKHEADVKEKFQDLVADTQIEFCFAGVDPNGNVTDGVNYVKSSLQFETINNEMKDPSRGGVEPWDPSKYLNIWVCDFPDRIAGFGQMPGGDKGSDGIVIDYNFIGSNGTAVAPYNEGKTLTHLIGNYFFLYDIWGPCYCCDDKVEDTPIHNGLNFGPNNVYKEVTLCDGNAAEMTMNYMDNTDDEWMYMFTQGQKIRMQAVLSENGPRNSLTQNINCVSQQAESRNTVELKLFPNPSSNSVEIEYRNHEFCELMIEDSYGRPVLKSSLLGNKTIDVSLWTAGMYIVNVYSNNEVLSKKLFVIK